MKTKTDPPGRGWFSVPGVRSGPHDLAGRIEGLEPLILHAPGASVLDLGCAEGLVSQWLVEAGAASADGLDYNQSRVAAGQPLTSWRVRLGLADLNDLSWLPPLRDRYDIVLMLAILQKLAEPERLLDFGIGRCRRWLAVRTPSPVITDSRSGRRELHVCPHVEGHGFKLVKQTVVSRGASSWVAIFEREHG